MLLSPKKTKFNKFFKSRIGSITTNGNTLLFGSYGLYALDAHKINARQIEAARKAIKRRLKRAGNLWIRIFPDIPVSAKPAEVRMGKGKGAIEYWSCNLAAGKILFELSGISEELAIDAFKLATAKLPIKAQFIYRDRIL